MTPEKVRDHRALRWHDPGARGPTAAQHPAVYITHLHGDHVGGITTADGKAVFPNAVVRADAKDGDYWLSQKNLDAAPVDMKDLFKGAMASIKPYADAGRFEPFSGASELVPWQTRDHLRPDLGDFLPARNRQCASGHFRPVRS